MSNQKFRSPGIYTSEKDLTFRKGRKVGGVLEATKRNDSGGITPTIKPNFWILRCGVWEDEGVWLDHSKWEDDVIWPCE